MGVLLSSLGTTLLIEEFVNGPNLLHFLRKHRPDQKKLGPSKPLSDRPLSAEDSMRPSGEETPSIFLLSWEELASLALQVAKGMEHLAAFKVSRVFFTFPRLVDVVAAKLPTYCLEY